MQVNNLMNDSGPLDYYDPAFRQVLEDHLTYLREHPSTTILTIEPARAYKYEADLFSLLSAYSVPVHYHSLIMRMNKMVVPTEATKDLRSLLVPEFSIVERIRQAHVTTRKVS